MTLEELIDAFRDRSGDTVTPPLWSDDEVTLFLNEAQNEACERARLILDTTSPEVCELYVSAGTSGYDLDPRVLEIRRAKLDLATRPLVETSIEELDAQMPGWESKTGTPTHFFQTSETGLTLVPKPLAADTLRLRVIRLPLQPMADDSDEPEIAAKHHYRMLDWALRCAYLKQDSEALDKQKAADHEAMFAASFGVRPDANVQRKRRDRRTPVVQMGTW